jgi:hypothetical protein
MTPISRRCPFSSQSPLHLRYSLVGEDSGLFSIDELTGELTVSASLDREQQELHKFQVRAEDGGRQGVRLAATALVIVTVQDENDNSPRILEDRREVQIPDNLRKGEFSLTSISLIVDRSFIRQEKVGHLSFEGRALKQNMSKGQK